MTAPSDPEAADRVRRPVAFLPQDAPPIPAPAGRGRTSLLAPLRNRTFRSIWCTSLLSNFGQLIQGVGASWEMTRLSRHVEMVALVQTAVMLPLMVVALPAGAIADMYDRRKVALAGLGFACLAAATLTAFAFAGLAGPWALLGFCFLIGVGVAFYGPAWQSSVSEQVEQRHLPAAVALGSISYNIARSFGPAVGGVVVLAAGAVGAFGLNALFYIPSIVALLLWRRVPAPSRLPPERFGRAIISGTRYAVHSPPIRVILLRTAATAVAGISVSALTPLIARRLLHGGAGTYGLLLGMVGVGSVVGVPFVGAIREKLSGENGVRLCALAAGLMILAIGLSHVLLLSCAALLVFGAAWTLMISLFNVGVQLAAPRWVTARALAWFSIAITGGAAFGAWGWGVLAGRVGIADAMLASGCAMIASVGLGLVLPMPGVSAAETETERLALAPEVSMAISGRSGPVNIEVDYRVDPERARAFYEVMQRVRTARLRSGGFGWSLSRDLADIRLWTERYTCPTWSDYLRQRTRATASDDLAQNQAEAFHLGDQPGATRVRRRLERPFGSVRWRNDSPDPGGDQVPLFPPR